MHLNNNPSIILQHAGILIKYQLNLMFYLNKYQNIFYLHFIYIYALFIRKLNNTYCYFFNSVSSTVDAGIAI